MKHHQPFGKGGSGRILPGLFVGHLRLEDRSLRSRDDPYWIPGIKQCLAGRIRIRPQRAIAGLGNSFLLLNGPRREKTERRIALFQQPRALKLAIPHFKPLLPAMLRNHQPALGQQPG